MKELIDLIRSEVAKGVINPTTAKVLSVDKDAKTCNVISTGTDEEYDDVLLIAAADEVSKPFVSYPLVNSIVGIIPLGSKSIWMVYLTSEVEEIHLCGDDHGGLVIAPELKTQLDKNNEILETILTVLQTPIPEPGNGANSAFQLALKSALNGKQVGDFSNIQNPKVKHG